MTKMSPYSKKQQKDELSEAPQVEELLKNLEFHKAIQSITKRIDAAETIREIVIDIKEDIRHLFNIHILSIYLVDQTAKEIFTLQESGAEVKEIRFPIDQTTFAGYVAQKKKMLYIADAYNERDIRKISDSLRFDPFLDNKTGLLTGQIIANPILRDGMILGVMEIMNKKGGEKIEDYHQIFLDEIAGFLAKAFFTQLNFAQIRQKYGVKYDALIQQGAITSGQMEKALKKVGETKEDLATILMEQYHVHKNDIGAALANYYACPFSYYNDDAPIPRDLLIGIEKSTLEKMLWVPLKVVKGKIHVFIDDPSDPIKKRKVEDILETRSIEYSVALASDIIKFINRFYADQENETLLDDEFEQPVSASRHDSSNVAAGLRQLDGILLHPDAPLEPENIPDFTVETERSLPEIAVADENIAPELATAIESAPNFELQTETEQETAGATESETPAGKIEALPPIAQIPADEMHLAAQKPSADAAVTQNHQADAFMLIINDACSRRATDIHFEPDPVNHNVNLRIRVDGQCVKRQTLSSKEYQTVVDEIKGLAHLDMKNRAIIQSGHLQLKRPSGEEITMRAAFIPTQAGLEDAVISFSAKAQKMPLELLGLSERNYTEWVNVLRQPRGMIFVVGPAGSGITTTLHACLENINTPDKKIWTAEEPVEIRQNGLRQVSIDPQKGFDFPGVLRSFLNADPDVIMASEARDLETARLCMEAALKGRLVLSSLPTDNICDAMERLLDMGIGSLLFADAMLSIMEQRLIKTLCPTCKEKYHPSPDEYQELKEMYGIDAFDRLNIPYSDQFSLFRPRGCSACGQTGYGGRMSVSEIFIFTAQVKRMLRRKESPALIYQTTISQDRSSLLQDGIVKVLQGHSDSRHVRLTCLK